MHVLPGRLTVLKCRLNKATYHPSPEIVGWVPGAFWGWAGEQSELKDVVKYHREVSLAYCVGRGLTVAGFDTRIEHHDYVHIRLK